MAVVGVTALLLVALVIRSALVKAYATEDPSLAAKLWADHPTVTLESGLAEIGDAAAAGRRVSPVTVERLIAASAKDPLAPEPFLVRAVQAQLSGDSATAERALLAARQRNPRLIAARYFLADHYLRAGDTERGLAEISALARLVPQSLPNVAPFLASYAQSPGAAPRVRQMVRQHPQLETALLNTLSANPGNLNLILYIWSGKGGDEARPWQGRLVNELVESGRYDAARTAWGRFTGISAARDRLFDPEFAIGALPPFGWNLVSGPSGVAEPEGSGRLHVLYYGRDNLVLASQLLTLPPGSYRLSMRISGASPAASALSWKVSCLPSGSAIGAIRLGAPGGLQSTSFPVPRSGCQAQRLQLEAIAPEFPEQVDLGIDQLRLERGPGQ